MANVMLGELLDRAADFENRLERYYASIRDHSQDNGVRLLTYYLARHRRHSQQAMENLDAEQVKHVRRMEIKHDVPFSPGRDFHVINRPPEDIKGNELLAAAVDYDQELIDLYRRILERPLSQEARGALENLIRIEERDIVMLKKMMAMNYF